MVRVASLKAQVEAEITKKSIDGLTPKEQLKKINNEIKKLTILQENYVNNELKNELKEKGVILKKYKDLVKIKEIGVITSLQHLFFLY